MSPNSLNLPPERRRRLDLDLNDLYEYYTDTMSRRSVAQIGKGKPHLSNIPRQTEQLHHRYCANRQLLG